MNPVVASALATIVAASEPDERPPIDWEKGLFAKQVEVLRCKAREKAVRVGRRGGKTHFLCRAALKAAAEREGARVVYLMLTRRNAKLIVWKWLKRQAHSLGLRYTTNESDLVMSVDGGGEILLGGADKIDQIEKWRGFFWDLAILDEMGSYPPNLLATLITDVIEPATMDYGGTVIFAGTPGYVLDGYWHAASREGSPVPVYHWNAKDNTALPDLWKRALELKEKRGWADDHPTWVREYLGVWVDDSGSLVYPYLRERNAAAALPRVGRTGANLLPAGWRFVLGIDVGYVHATAFVVLAAHPLQPEVYVVHAEKQTEMLPRQVAQRIRSLRVEVAHRLGVPQHKLDRCSVVMDTGGQGKPHAEECSRVFGIAVEAAEKREKESAVRLMRGELIAGRIKILDGPECDPIREEYAVLGWDHEKRLPAKDHSARFGGAGDHASDAALYAFRKMRHYRQEDPDAPPGTSRAEELEMLEAAERKLTRQEPRRKGRRAWDR